MFVGPNTAHAYSREDTFMLAGRQASINVKSTLKIFRPKQISYDSASFHQVPKMSNFMKIRSAVLEILHEYGQMDGSVNRF